MFSIKHDPISPIASQIRFLTLEAGSFDRWLKIYYLKRFLVSCWSWGHKFVYDFSVCFVKFFLNYEAEYILIGVSFSTDKAVNNN